MGRNSTPSKENSPAIKRTRRKILDEDTNSDEENINKTPSKKSKVKNPGTPIPKLKLKKVQILHCDDDDVYFVKDISNEQVSKRRKASAKPNLDDVTEGSTEDDEDEDVKETIAVSLIIVFGSFEKFREIDLDCKLRYFLTDFDSIFFVRSVFKSTLFFY